jgi:hypothetical protein
MNIGPFRWTVQRWTNCANALAADGIIYSYWNATKCLHITPLQASRKEKDKKALIIRRYDRNYTLGCISAAQTDKLKTDTKHFKHMFHINDDHTQFHH